MSFSDVSAMRILVVDDELPNLVLLQNVLRGAGYTNVETLKDPREFSATFEMFKPDLVLLDLLMPHVTGYDILGWVKEHVPQTVYLPVVVITADITLQSKQKALAAGATDFLYKPIDVIEVSLRVGNLLRARALYLEITRQNQNLEQQVQDRSRALVEAHLEVLSRLANAAELRDDDTGQHTRRVGNLAAHLAEGLGLPSTKVTLIRHAAPLHDVGKIGVPDSILRKPERLNDEELEVMRRHPKIGAQILEGSSIPVINEAEVIALTHHEWWDGNGYPAGLAGEDIPIAGRIVAVADVFDALTHERPYKRAWLPEAAVTEIRRLSGKQFDVRVVNVFITKFGVDGKAALAV